MSEDNMTITEAEGTWVIRAGGAVIGESDRALQLEEGDAPFMIFFPREDVEMAFLEPTGQTTVSPSKGVARSYALIVKSGEIPGAALSYEEPNDAVARLRDYLAFFVSDLVTVEQV